MGQGSDYTAQIKVPAFVAKLTDWIRFTIDAYRAYRSSIGIVFLC